MIISSFGITTVISFNCGLIKENFKPVFESVFKNHFLIIILLVEIKLIKLIQFGTEKRH